MTRTSTNFSGDNEDTKRWRHRKLLTFVWNPLCKKWSSGGEWVTGWCHPQKLPGFLSKEHQVQKLNALREQISLASHSSKWQKVLNLLSDHLTVASAYGWSLAISACAKASQWRQALALYAAGGRDAVVCAAVIGSCQRTVTFLKWKWSGEL